jgi:hypothetical protein
MYTIERLRNGEWHREIEAMPLAENRFQNEHDAQNTIDELRRHSGFKKMQFRITPEPIEYSIKFVTTARDIDDLISTAFEQGIGYWARVRVDGNDWILVDNEAGGKEHGFSRKQLFVGIAICATKYPKHFANWITGGHDAETADVLVQCAIFGEIVYG